MIKNLFFDLDNTIIKDELIDSECYKEALKNCGFDESNYINIYNAIDEYDKTFTEENRFYKKQEMLDFINEYLNTDYTIELIDEILRISGENWAKEERILLKKNVLEYLSKKYNLYIYTNYFEVVQKRRIEKIDYLKYFKKIFAADNYGVKPFKESFEKILSEIDAKADECIMIGDDKSRDCLAAQNINMKSILFDYNGKRDRKDILINDYEVVDNLDKLLEIL